MPPKKAKNEPGEVASSAPPPDPAVIAAQDVITRWEKRHGELVSQCSESHVQIKDLSAQKTKREMEIKDLQGKVSDLASPRLPVPSEPAAKSAKVAKGKAAPVVETPSVPPEVLEEEQKKVQRNTTLLLNGFKRKRDRITKMTVLENGEEAQVVEDAPVAKPTDFDPDVWAQMLKFRSDKFTGEDTINSMGKNLDTLTARRDVLLEMKEVARYSLEAAQFDLKKIHEKLNPPAADQLSPEPAATEQAPRSPSQVVRTK